ncbi:MAG: RidA family protein [Thermoplasmata archaeon]|nr:RidA family protein [Thermoplasmata archaeon]
MPRQRFSSGTPWEDRVGYARAVRSGRFVWISGTTATGPDGRFVGGSAYDQTKRAIDNIERALAAVGASLADVVRTRLYVADISEWSEIGRAHAERFSEIRPATAMVQVAGLLDPAMRVEIEVDAVIERPRTVSKRAGSRGRSPARRR